MLSAFTVGRYLDKLAFSADLRLLCRPDDCGGGERLLNLRWWWTGSAWLAVWVEASWWRRWCGWAFGWSRIFLRRFPKRRSRKCCTWSRCGNMSENRNSNKSVSNNYSCQGDSKLSGHCLLAEYFFTMTFNIIQADIGDSARCIKVLYQVTENWLRNSKTILVETL